MVFLNLQKTVAFLKRFFLNGSAQAFKKKYIITGGRFFKTCQYVTEYSPLVGFLNINNGLNIFAFIVSRRTF